MRSARRGRGCDPGSASPLTEQTDGSRISAPIRKNPVTEIPDVLLSCDPLNHKQFGRPQPRAPSVYESCVLVGRRGSPDAHDPQSDRAVSSSATSQYAFASRPLRARRGRVSSGSGGGGRGTSSALSAFRVLENGLNKPCARHDSNVRPLPPQGSALSPELRARFSIPEGKWRLSSLA
jgi:hypothetical protein